MKNRRSVSLCIEGILLLIVLACSLAVRDTATRPAAAAVRIGMSAADAAERSVRDAAPLAVRESTDANALLQTARADDAPITFDPDTLLLPCVAYLWLFTLLTCVYAAR